MALFHTKALNPLLKAGAILVGVEGRKQFYSDYVTYCVTKLIMSQLLKIRQVPLGLRFSMFNCVLLRIV